jgi:hypothetical protein
LLFFHVYSLLDLSNSLLGGVIGAIVIQLETTLKQLRVRGKSLPVTLGILQQSVNLAILLHDRRHILRYELLIDLKLSVALLEVRTMLPQRLGGLRLLVFKLLLLL